MTARVLIVAGSDSGGGAGIQADIKTVTMLGGHAMTAITAITAQNTLGVQAVHPIPTAMVLAQIDSVAGDIGVDAVKIGMIGSAETAAAVAERLAQPDLAQAAVVFDPVMVATSGAKLLEDSALQAMRSLLLPLAHVVTPNLPEAELLLGRAIADAAAMRQAARDLLALGARAVFLKGGHLPGDADVVDLYCDEDGLAETSHPRLPLEAHGTGCTLASAIAARRAQGMPMKDACLAASDYVHAALRGGYRPGRSDILVLDHVGAAPRA